MQMFEHQPYQTTNGYLVSQSSDATCYGGLSSPTEGFQTFVFSNGKNERGNLFPVWTFPLDRLLSFDFSKLYTFNEDHSLLTVSNFSYTTKETHLLSKISVIQIVEAGQHHVKMVTKTLTGCEQIYTCTVLHKRTDSVLELEEGLPTRVMLAACAETNFVPGSRVNKFTTLLKENLDSEQCQVTGVHNVTSLNLNSQTEMCDMRGFTRLEIGCSARDHVQFIRECSGYYLSQHNKYPNVNCKKSWVQCEIDSFSKVSFSINSFSGKSKTLNC